MEPTKYAIFNKKTGKNDLVFWDLPGGGTKKFSAGKNGEDYIREMGLTWFNFVLVCSNGRIRELEVDIAERLNEKEVEFCVVRTQMDTEIDDAFKREKEEFDSDDEDEEPVSIDNVKKRVESEIRDNLYNQMSNISKDKLKTYWYRSIWKVNRMPVLMILEN
eukprot:UN34307